MTVVLDTLFRFHPSLTINNYDFKVAVVFSYWVNVIGSCSIINKLSDLHSPNLLQIEFTCRIKKKKTNILTKPQPQGSRANITNCFIDMKLIKFSWNFAERNNNTII